MNLLIVIVNYRTADLVVDCLGSLEPEVGAVCGVRVVINDNASGDDSVDRLERAIRQHEWDAWATVRALPRNGGFAWGNNQAIRPALASGAPPRYVLLLNPDTVVRPGALPALLSFMDAHPNVGIAGARLETPGGTPQWSACRFPSIAGELENGLRLGIVSRLLARHVVATPPPPDPQPTDWVSGAAMIVRREVFDAIGLLDESYFMYFEETDFCVRARRAGWPCWYMPDARIVHLVGRSTCVDGPAAQRPPVSRYWFESRRRYFLVHHGALKAATANVAWALGYALWRIRRVLQRKPDRDPQGLLADFVRYNFLLTVVKG